MAMIFSLLTFLEDWIIASSTTKKKGAGKRLVLAAEDGAPSNPDSASSPTTLIEEKVLAAGTPVTRDSFLRWREAFLKETSSLPPISTATATASKLTGKQLFEQNRALAASDAGFGVEEGDVVEIDEALFASIRFEDGDDDDEGDEEEVVYCNDGNISD